MSALSSLKEGGNYAYFMFSIKRYEFFPHSVLYISYNKQQLFHIRNNISQSNLVVLVYLI